MLHIAYLFHDKDRSADEPRTRCGRGARAVPRAAGRRGGARAGEGEGGPRCTPRWRASRLRPADLLAALALRRRPSRVNRIEDGSSSASPRFRARHRARVPPADEPDRVPREDEGPGGSAMTSSPRRSRSPSRRTPPPTRPGGAAAAAPAAGLPPPRDARVHARERARRHASSRWASPQGDRRARVPRRHGRRPGAEDRALELPRGAPHGGHDHAQRRRDRRRHRAMGRCDRDERDARRDGRRRDGAVRVRA